ncbi:MAG TPA: FISUMP domain-containing protein [Candidatus Nanoarchaeia archaeon]|nr:FISUMP domain-containing protein [Candidatus Nanoarchaeia archaeon]
MSKFPSKIKRGVGKGLLYLLMATPLFFNCRKEEVEEFEPEINGEIFENVQIVSKNKLEEISEIDSTGTINFEKAQDYETGDILAGGISEKTPGGLLKKITEISEDGKKVKTVNASLDEAIKEGGFNYSKNFNLEDFNEIEAIKGLKYGKSDFNFEFNEVLIDLDGDFSTTNDQVEINGNIYFDIQTEIDAGFGFGGINFSFENWIEENSSLEAVANAKFVNFDKEILIFHASGTPFQIPGAPIPLIARPEFELYLGTQGELKSELKSKLENNFECFGGIYYDKGWTSKNNWNNEFVFYEPEVSIKGNLEAYCKPKLNLIINEIAGPSAGMKGYLEMKVDNEESPWWNLYGGYDVFLGISSGWLTKSFGSYEENVLEFKKKIKDSGESENLEAKLTASPQEGFFPLEVLFDASNSTGDIIEYCFNFGNGEDHIEKEGEEEFDGKFNYLYEVEGNYEVNLNIKDESGKTDSKNLEILVKEPLAPFVDFDVSPESGTEKTVFEFDASMTYDDEDDFDDLFFRWDFEGDGIWETDFEKEYFKEHKYENFGNYTPTLEVKDSRGLVSKINKELEVEELTEDIFVDERDGEEYKIIKIGDDWWFAENLRYKFGELDHEYVYGGNWENYQMHGLIYDSSQKPCPAGWHISTDQDWKNLEKFYGMDSTEIDLEGWRGEGISNILKNEEDFNLTLSGYGLKYSYGIYYRNLNCKGIYWTSTKHTAPYRIVRGIDIEKDEIFRGHQDFITSSYWKVYSIRCVKNN